MAQEEARRHDVKLQPLFPAHGQRFGNIGAFHEAVIDNDDANVGDDLFNFDPVGISHARCFSRSNAQDRNFLMQNLIVLEVMHQGHRR